VAGGVQLPQLSVPPQPSEISPQSAPTPAQVSGVQPHTLGVPAPPQIWGGEHAPQSSTAPHPSPVCPHSAARLSHVEGTQGVEPH
jgi:hypothetical protein